MLAILTTHPIQYQVPLWQALARDGRVPFEVWYLTSHATAPSRDREFGKEFAWDLDMLSGYPHKFLDVAEGATPGSFWKCRLKERLRDRLRESNARALWINGWQVAAYWQAVREAKAAGVEVWLRGESGSLGANFTAGGREREDANRHREAGDSVLVKTERFSPRRLARHLLLNWLFSRVDRFLYIGSANKRLYQKFGVSNEKLFPAPYAVDNARFAEQASVLRARRMELREEWRISRDAFVILFCGKFIPKKRPMDLVEAATRLRREQGARGEEQGVHLLFAGSGELGPQLRAACNVVFDAEGANSSHVTRHSSLPMASFAGFLNQTEVSRAYVAADVLVLPSDYSETWGLVVNEAMASGLPCIVSDHCGCAEDLIPNELTFGANNVDELANTIQRLKSSMGRSQSPFPLPSFFTTVDTVAQIFARAQAGRSIR